MAGFARGRSGVRGVWVVTSRAATTGGRRWWQRPIVGRAITAAAIGGIVAAWLLLNLRGTYFRDAMAYWGFDFSDLYGGGRVGIESTYLYSPAFAQLLSPFSLLPWEVFAALWSALNLGALVWMAGPRLAALLFLIPGSPIGDEISTGNLHLLLGAAVVLGFRTSGMWALPLLTKVTPGIGLLWFAGRREWRNLLFATGVTLGIAVLSFAIGPNQWFDWIDTLRRSNEVTVSTQVAVVPGPIAVRVVVAAGIAIYAGATNRRWLAPVPVFLALPVTWSSGLAILVAMIPLGRADAVDFARRAARGRGTRPWRTGQFTGPEDNS
jgi:hypothetical protein